MNDGSCKRNFAAQLAQTPVLVFELLHAGHHGGVHAAELGPPFVKRRGADTQLPADIRHWQYFVT